MTALLALAAVGLLMYGVLTMLVASAWGPGNSDELVSGGPGLIPWFGLSTVGTVAALVGLALAFGQRPRLAAWSLLIAVVALAGWTGFLFFGLD
jgi:hypothetical protein